jgi:hypothetical protein
VRLQPLEPVSQPNAPQRILHLLACTLPIAGRTGRVLNVLDLAREYGFTDLDGTLTDWDY